jgi:hypothetical protein
MLLGQDGTRHPSCLKIASRESAHYAIDRPVTTLYTLFATL